MIHRLRTSFPLAPAMLALAASAPPPVEVSHRVAQVTIHERIVVRVPRAAPAYPVGRTAIAPPVSWKEGKGPKCLDIGDIAAAALAEPAAVDLLLIDGRRVRARLERDCRSADFYSGLYVRPGADGRICADRDAIRVRSGAACGIDGFRLLTAR